MSEKLKSDPKGTFIQHQEKCGQQVGKQKVYEKRNKNSATTLLEYVKSMVK